MKDELKMNELCNDELDMVSGGKLDFRTPDGKDNPNDVVFRFNVGDIVEVLFCDIVFYGSVTDRSRVISREARLNNGKYYPYYETKRLDNGDKSWQEENRLSF